MLTVDLFAFVEACRMSGWPMKVVYVLAYGNPNVHPTDVHSQAWRDAFADYGCAVAESFLATGMQPDEFLLTVMNEVNTAEFFDGFQNDGAAYAELARTVRRRAKRIDDRIRICAGEAVNGSWSGTRGWWAQAFEKGNDWADIFTTHEYHGAHFPEYGPPEYLFYRTRFLFNWLAQIKQPGQTFAITECGFPTDDAVGTQQLMDYFERLPVEFVTHYAFRESNGFEFVGPNFEWRRKAEAFAQHGCWKGNHHDR